MPKKVGVEFNSDSICLFSEVDFNDKGEITSDYPAWYFNRLEEEIEESIRRKEREIEAGIVDKDVIDRMKTEIKMEKKRLEEIKEGKPKLKGAKLDELASIRSELEEKIRESFFKFDDMMKGYADPHKEAQRMVKPCISLRDKAYEFARANFVKFDKSGKCTRNDLVRLWKIAGKAIQESTGYDVTTNVTDILR